MDQAWLEVTVCAPDTVQLSLPYDLLSQQLSGLGGTTLKGH